MNLSQDTWEDVFSCVNAKTGKGFCIVPFLMIKSGYTTTTQNEKRYGVSSVMHQHPWKS